MAADDFRISHVDIGNDASGKNDRLLITWAGEFGVGKFEIGRDENDDSFNMYFDSNETDPKLIKAVLSKLVDDSVIRKTTD